MAQGTESQRRLGDKYFDPIINWESDDALRDWLGRQDPDEIEQYLSFFNFKHHRDREALVIQELERLKQRRASGFGSEIRRQFKDHLARTIVLGVFGLLSLAGASAWAWIVGGGLTTAVGGIPPGAVVAFAQRYEEVPGRWSLFDKAGGRVIVGAGPHQNDWYRSDDLDRETALRISTYAVVGETPDANSSVRSSDGGEETHTLTVEEIPGHTHSILAEDGPGNFRSIEEMDLHVALHLSDSGGANKSNSSDGDLSKGGRRMRLSDTGGSQPYNNIPPYIALYFCIKE